MAYLRTIRRGKRTYYYVVKSVRRGDTVRQKVLQYLGEADAVTLKQACNYWEVKMTRPAQVAKYLRSSSGTLFCDDHLAAETGANRHEVQTITDSFSQTREFERKDGTCSKCGPKKMKKVTRAVPEDGPEDKRGKS